MSDDIVERLRAMAQGEARSGIGRQRRDLFEEAADEIVRLHVELEKAYDAKEDLQDAMSRIKRWSEAYPFDIFPEPDLMRARHVLEAAGMTLDAISASAMRHAVEGVGKIASAALKEVGGDDA